MMDSKNCMGGMCVGHKICWILLVIGGLNWGLIGLGAFWRMDWNVVHMIFGTWPMVEWAIYLLVGIATLMMLFKHACKMCMVEMKKK